MEYEKIKQLMEDMGNSKLTSIDIDFPDGTKISMKKEEKQTTIVNNVSSRNNIQEENDETKVDEKKEDSRKLNIIKSPMVGTFYLKPSPTADPYVEIGKEVKKGDTVCIVEAMKLMNERESEFDGKIAEIYVKDGEAVGYGEPLFGIE